jgi:hypothetical protein
MKKIVPLQIKTKGKLIFSKSIRMNTKKKQFDYVKMRNDIQVKILSVFGWRYFIPLLNGVGLNSPFEGGQGGCSVHAGKIVKE